MTIPYRHEPFTDFSNEVNREEFRQALTKVEGQLGKEIPLRINGESVTTDEKIVSLNPAKKRNKRSELFQRRLKSMPRRNGSCSASVYGLEKVGSGS